MKTIFSYMTICLLLIGQVAMAAVTASLDRHQVYEGDTVTLSLETDGNTQASPDLSALQADFELLGTGRSSNISIINGRQSIKTGWQVRLRPRHLGELSIPSIEIGGEKTRPLTLKVERIPADVARRQADQLFVETQVESGKRAPYVQQQVKLIVRLYYRVRLLDGELSDPRPDGDVVFERLGDDKRYETLRDGKRYQVIEREYAMFPQRSGTLNIPPVVFSGRAAVRQSSGQQRSPRTRMDSLMQRFFGEDPFMDDFFSGSPFGQRGKRIVARSPARALRVMPRPKDYKGATWLPAADVELLDSWAENPPRPRVGEPITRTLTLRAKGLEDSQLPEIEIPASDAYSVYPEQATTRNVLQDGWVVGERRQDFTLVPKQAGKLVVPAVSIDWWDTRQDRQRQTVLPRWELSVLPGSGARASNTPAATAGQANSVSADETAKATSVSSTARPDADRWRDVWPWLSAMLALGLATAIVWWVRARRPAKSAQDDARAGQETTAGRPKPTRADLGAARDRLRQACADHDARAIGRALLAMAKLQWPDDPPLDLRALAKRLPKQADPIRVLDRSLYAGETQNLAELDGLCEAFREGFDTGGGDERKAVRDDLAPLYPRVS